MALIAGSRVGAYELISLLGAGGMGEVYLTEDLRLGRKVALRLNGNSGAPSSSNPLTPPRISGMPNIWSRSDDLTIPSSR